MLVYGHKQPMLVASQASAIHAEEAAAMRQNSQRQFHGEKAAEPEPGKASMDMERPSDISCRMRSGIL